MIYLACAYTFNPQKAYSDIVKILATLLKKDVLVLSPIAHSHVAAVEHGLPLEWEWWEKLDQRYIDVCSEVWVWVDPADEWKKSTGVQAEIKYARETGKPVRFFSDPEKDLGLD